MQKIKTLIIDDERSNRELINNIVPRLNDSFYIAGEADNVEDAFTLIKTNKPEIVFLDIQLRRENAFDLLAKFDTVDFEIIFVTAYIQYSHSAFKYYAADYMMKPIDTDRLKSTLDRIEKKIHLKNILAENFSESIKLNVNHASFIPKIPIHHHDHVILLGLNDVMYVQAHEGCTYFYKSTDEKYTSAKQLGDYEVFLETLPNFVRIHKSCYVNLNFIVSYSKGTDCNIVMKDQSVHEVSRRKKTEILHVLINAHKEKN